MVRLLLLPLFMVITYLPSASGQWTTAQVSTGDPEIEQFNSISTEQGAEKKDARRLRSETAPMLNSTEAAQLDRKPMGKRTGQLLGYDALGNLVFVAGYNRSKIEGAWVGHYTNGKVRDEGSFLRNIPDGEWKGYYPNGQARYVRHFSADKWFAIQSEIKRRHPRIQHFALTKEALLSRTSYDKSTSATHSFSTLVHDEIPYMAPFQYCLHDGLYLNYFQNGVAKDSGYYKDGLRDGVWQERHRNGIVKATGFYISGQKHGGWTLYNELGALISLTEYHRGKMIHQKFYEAQAKP